MFSALPSFDKALYKCYVLLSSLLLTILFLNLLNKRNLFDMFFYNTEGTSDFESIYKWLCFPGEMWPSSNINSTQLNPTQLGYCAPIYWVSHSLDWMQSGWEYFDVSLRSTDMEGFRFLGVGGNRSARRKPTKAGMESANQIHIQPLANCIGKRIVFEH